MDQSEREMLRQNLLQLMEETLHSHQSMYTNPGTSLLETVQGIDAALASKAFPNLPETIAGHVSHAAYYLNNLLAILKGGEDTGFDVKKSWERAKVDAQQWEALKQELQDVYSQVMRYLATSDTFASDNRIAGLVAMIAHSAYHLGAIRQLKEF